MKTNHPKLPIALKNEGILSRCVYMVINSDALGGKPRTAQSIAKLLKPYGFQPSDTTPTLTTRVHWSLKRLVALKLATAIRASHLPTRYWKRK